MPDTVSCIAIALDAVGRAKHDDSRRLMSPDSIAAGWYPFLPHAGALR